ncbi:MAG: hypothetical protein CVU09_09545 [Bacteroidetes bacterium HGW-Bacteroidetes-4]|jgi:hypothetical protein|nr:MAG: hypothetical protein CVU09_09545 [Bacteroidetes bacterium HGW-Bacteroidetes-4]
MQVLKADDKRALLDWSEYRENLIKLTSVEYEPEEAKRVRIKHLEKNPEEWFKYYFPNYAYAEPAEFHKKATKRIMSNDNWYEVRAWSRELAKSTRGMMEFIFMAMTGKLKNIVLVSHSYDQAEILLKPFKINFESNQRLINDYGIQEKPGEWTSGLFVIRAGCSFCAIGSGQSPRGFKNEEIRPDGILIDDIDTDEEARNPERIKTKWKWIEEALFFSMSVSKRKLILFLGNIIGKDTCITRAIKKADYASIVNIRDKNGISSWAAKNTEEAIDWMLNKVSYAAGQKEFFNNPISEGSVFKEMRWGKVPPLSKFPFLLKYGDPAPSNKENKSNSNKANLLLGMLGGKLYVITGYLEQVTNSKFVNWYWDLEDYVKGKNITYNYIENNSLQDPFYEQVFLPLFKETAITRQKAIYPTPDERKKPDKFTRIEGNLEPLNRLGNLILNEAERNNPHMLRLEEQFKLVEPTLSANVDGPDAVEGGYWVILTKLKVVKKEDIATGPRGRQSGNRY